MISSLRGYILVFVGVVFFATSLPFSALAVSGFDPFTAGVGRSALGGLLSAATLLILRPPLPRGDQWKRLIYAGVGTGFIFPFFTNVGMSTVAPDDGAVVIAVLPLSTALFARFIEPERRLNAWFWIGSLLACGLVAAFILQEGFGGVSAGHLALIASLLVGFSYAWAGRIAREIPAWQVICWASIMALPVQFLGFAVLWPTLDFVASLDAWAGLIFGALGAQWAGFFFFYAGFAIVGAARGSLVQYLQPFITILIVAVVSFTFPDPQMFLYAGAVILALFLTRMRSIGH